MGSISIVGIRFVGSGEGQWTAHATLRHRDSGWEHYADAWRVVDVAGKELGMRTLFHPHVSEQPFTRSLSGVRIAGPTTVVIVEAHDKVHGWSADRVQVRLDKPKGPRYIVEP